MKGDTPIVTNAYAVVPKDEEAVVVNHMSTASPRHVGTTINEIPLSAVALDRPARPLFTTSSTYSHIPEARGLQWHDEFFEDDPSVVSVFDLNYQAMEKYYGRVGWTGWTIGAVCLPGFLTISILSCIPCFLNDNVRWHMRAQHVAVTREGIRFVHDKRKTMWGFGCTDAGKHVKTIPFDQITDITLEEPAGNTCAWIPNELYTVHIDTAKSAGKCGHELSLTGLQDPNAFKRLVWAMKGVQVPAAAASVPGSSPLARLPEALSMVDRGIASSGDGEVAGLLRDIRDELRQQKEILQQQQGSSSAAASAPQPSAPRQDDKIV